ncbi:hypothetical protein N136_01208 [Leifsonia aquatica ATCC 14665]|uniref:Uncharacterized protein n=1 Tax=Leifsonia aquatica ATCC 14665 TaxID=1358026 RepID=U2T4P1_LEIAQ|nr:hypothetical protein N136_01208 [Leifsonia aquatica ATCC 14665]
MQRPVSVTYAETGLSWFSGTVPDTSRVRQYDDVCDTRRDGNGRRRR